MQTVTSSGLEMLKIEKIYNHELSVHMIIVFIPPEHYNGAININTYHYETGKLTLCWG